MKMSKTCLSNKNKYCQLLYAVVVPSEIYPDTSICNSGWEDFKTKAGSHMQ